MSKVRSIRVGVTIAAAILIACVAAPTAGATTSHPSLFTIFYFPQQPEYFEDPCGVTVRPDGGLYAADYYHDRIVSFDANGNYLAVDSEVDPTDGPCGLAADAAGDLFVNDFHGEIVRQSSLGASETIDPGPATGVVYDPGSGWVYVDDRDHVAVYEESGEPVEVGGEPLLIGVGGLVNGYGVAVSDHPGTEGFVYVADAATNTIKVFDPATDADMPAFEIDGAGDPEGGFATLRDAAVAVDDASGNLYVVYNAQGPLYEHPLAAVAEFDPAGEYSGSLPVSSLVFGEPSGIAVDNTGGTGQGRIFVTSGNSQVERPAESPCLLRSGKRQEGAVYAFAPTVASGPLLQVNVTGCGTVRSEPAGIACPEACSAEFTAGTTVTLTAVPAGGETFNGWSGGCSGTGSCTVTMTADTTIGAAFGPPPPGGAHVADAPPAPSADAPAGAAAPPAPSAGPSAIVAGPATATAAGPAAVATAVVAAPRRVAAARHHRRGRRAGRHHHGRGTRHPGFRHRKVRGAR